MEHAISVNQNAAELLFQSTVNSLKIGNGVNFVYMAVGTMANLFEQYLSFVSVLDHK